MNVRKTLRHIALGAVLTLIAGCGVGTGDTVVASGGLTGTGITQGTVTGFGSIHVNGVRYITDTATFERDGVTSAISDFEVGEIVSLRWTLDADGMTRNASFVFYDTEIKGFVTEALDPLTNTIGILHQTVQVTGSTAFQGAGIAGAADLNVGDYVELNAFQQTYDPNEPIALRATAIEFVSPAPADIELKGVVKSIDIGTSFLIIGGMTVNWSVPPDATPSVGDYVKVTGTFNHGSEEIDDATITAAARGIEIDASDEDEAELEGVVTSLTNQDEFEVNGQPVVTAPDVTYEPAGLILAAGDRVEVEGTINAFGILIAETIETRDEGDIEIEGDITAIDLDKQSITVWGVEVLSNELTQFDDESSADLQVFGFSNLGTYNHVAIRATRNSSGNIVATRLERNDSTEIALQDVVTAKTSTSITILEQVIDASSVSRYDVNDNPIPIETFLGAITIGETIVHASGTEAASWTELEIEE